MAEDLVYRPAKRSHLPLLIGLSGPSSSGKTYSALRLARGLAGPNGTVGYCDTERGRALHYADDFAFMHTEMHDPFSPMRYVAAAEASKRAGHSVLIIDSMSHEHAGPGGLLEMHEAELQRLVPNGDYARREAMKMVAWIKPKTQHKAMVQRLLQLGCHLILCFRAERKTEMRLEKNRQGNMVMTPVSIGFQPISDKDMVFEMTVMLGFEPSAPGIPVPIKLQGQHTGMIPLDRPLDESAGVALAAWARGEKSAPAGQWEMAGRTEQAPRLPAESPADSPFLIRAEAAIKKATNAMQFAKLLPKITAEAQSQDDIAALRTIPEVAAFEVKATATIRGQIAAALSEAWQRLASPDDPDEPDEPEIETEAALTTPDHPADEEEDDGWPGPRTPPDTRNAEERRADGELP